ncbi:MlaD family protein [Veillonella criceti]|uniref:Virulence factor Mce family protein n=1 Tax=Veillonella criceti TaxID=103891 RepID=A0A380NJI4_9FIRM|nr:MlaD family protein [Veillonella criceti]SUP42516.1 virulence factor Mce family protein [Veillonella criceti]
MKWSTEAKVGLFTIIGLCLFAACVIFLGRLELFQPPQMHITGEFQSVTGLKTGNQIKYSGVAVGRVTDMEVTSKGVTLIMEIKDDTEIPVDSEFSLANDGILGDKFIQITPGHSKTFLKDGDIIHGDGQSDIDKTMRQATVLMEEANKTLGSINNVIGDAQTQAALRNALRTTEDIANNTAELTARMNQMVASNEGNLNEITTNMAGITRNMTNITNQLDTSLQELNGDGQAASDMRAILSNLRTTTNSLNNMASSMEGVVTDPQSSKDIKETLHNTAQLTTKLNRLTGGDVESSDSGKKYPFKASANIELLYNTTSDKYNPNADFRLQFGKSMFTLGATNIGDNSQLELTYGKYVANDFLLRGGLFDGDVGIGVDYGLNGPFSISAAVMDFNDTRYRIRSEVRLFEDTYAVAQFIRPFSAENGGNFYGIRHVF